MANYLKPVSLGLLFLSLLSLFGPASATQMAIVKSERAIVYAEPTLKTKLGFVSKGRQVVVGSHPKGRNLRILPIIVDQKVAFIRLDDLHWKEENKQYFQENLERQAGHSKQSQIKRIKIERFKMGSIEKKILLDYQLIHPGPEWTGISSSVESKSFPLNGHLVHLAGEAHFFDNWGLRGGGSWLRIQQKSVALNAQGFHGGIAFSFPFENFDRYDWIASYLHFPKANFRILDHELSGTMSGFMTSIQFRHEFSYHWMIRYGVGYYMMNSNGIKKKFNYRNQYNIDIQEVSLKGMQFLFNFLFRF